MTIKKSILLALLGACALVLAACSNDAGTNDTDAPAQTRFPAADLSEYGIEGEHRFYQVTMYEALQLRTEADFDGILYFGFPGCPWCRDAVPVMHEASQSTGIDVLYVSRDHELREGEWLEWDAEMAWWLYESGLPGMLWIDEDGRPVDDMDNAYRPNIFVPQIVHVQDGAIINSHRSTFEDHDARERSLTPEEHEALHAIYVGIFENASNLPAGVCSEDDDEACS